MPLTLAESARAVRVRDASPVELVEQALERAERWQPVTNAFSQVRAQEAMEEARARAEEVAAGGTLGSLHGVPIAVKDLFDVTGWETSGCSLGYRGNLARQDAALVRLLREAGAIIIAKTNQHELAAGATNSISALGPTRNPWDPSRITGGSSGGSAAAVASRVVPLAMGTDTGGSIRIPASLCGVCGLKPSTGRLSMKGAMPLSPTLDTPGPLAATVEDVAIAYGVLAELGPKFVEETAGTVGGLRVGILGGIFAERIHGEAREALVAVADVLEAQGAKLAHVEVAGVRDAPDVWLRVAWPEFAAAHGHLLRRPETVYPATRKILEEGNNRPAVDYLKARERAEQLRVAFLETLSEVDVLLAPTTPIPAPRPDEERVEVSDGEFVDARTGLSVLTRPANLVGLPALAFPAGASREEGLPLGVQVIGRPGDEVTLLRLGRSFQDATEHHTLEPTRRSER